MKIIDHRDALATSDGQRHSQLARMARVVLLGMFLVSVAWFSFWHSRSPVLAWVGVALGVLGYALVLALEMMLVWWVNQSDPAPRAGPSLLAQAWWQEVRAGAQVFGWRQPFRWYLLPDDARPRLGAGPAVVFIHGFVCNRGFWQPWMRILRREGKPYVSVNLEPVFGGIEAYLPLVEAAVQRAKGLTGEQPLLVCHSMGGLVARAWLASDPANAERVHHVVTIGTPHHGTWPARFSSVPNGRQMRQAGPWLKALTLREAGSAIQPDYRHFTCWFSNADNIVFPASTATLPGADNRLVPGAAHVALAFQPRVMRESLAMLSPAAISAEARTAS